MQKKTIIEMSCQELDDLVEKTYGRCYTFQQQDGCKNRGYEAFIVPNSCDFEVHDYENDSVPDIINGREMGVSFEAWKARDPKEWKGDPEDERFIDLFWARNFYPAPQVLLNDLHEKGLLEAGEYVIVIDW